MGNLWAWHRRRCLRRRLVVLGRRGRLQFRQGFLRPLPSWSVLNYPFSILSYRFLVSYSVHISFCFCLLEGIFASLAALMFNSVRKEDIDYSPYEEGEWRSGFFSTSFVLIVQI